MYYGCVTRRAGSAQHFTVFFTLAGVISKPIQTEAGKYRLRVLSLGFRVEGLRLWGLGQGPLKTLVRAKL